MEWLVEREGSEVNKGVGLTCAFNRECSITYPACTQANKGNARKGIKHRQEGRLQASFTLPYLARPSSPQASALLSPTALNKQLLSESMMRRTTHEPSCSATDVGAAMPLAVRPESTGREQGILRVREGTKGPGGPSAARHNSSQDPTLNASG